MGCYGIGPSRVLGTVVEIHHDEQGIIWPESIAPFDIHLLVLGDSQDVMAQAKKIHDQLVKSGKDVLMDDREVSAGVKFADADLMGMPTRIIVSEKTLAKDSVEVKKRSEKESELKKIKDLK